MIKLIASDMDGTLLDQNKKLPENFFEILSQLNNKNIKFVVASGRCYSTLYENFKPYSDKVDYISDNGANVIINGKNTFTSIIDDDLVKDVIETYKALEKKNVYILMCGHNATFFNKKSATFIDEITNYYNNKEFVDDLLNVKEPIFKISVYDLNGPQNYSYKILSEKFSKCLNIQISGHFWIDIVNKDVNKGFALSKIKQNLNVSYDETMVFGDFYNDIELLQQGKYSFVMSNANEDMFKYGNYKAKSNTENGVIETILKYTL